MKDFNMYNRTADLLEQDIISAYKMDESTCVAKLLDTIWHNEKTTEKANNLATTLINHVRTSRLNGSGVDVLLQEFKLSTIEGVALMCLAESLLRIPDSYTQKKLIKDKLLNASWYDYTKTDNLFVNAVSWGLLISNTLINKNEVLQSDTMLVKLSKALCAVINRLGEPVILAAIKTAVKFMGNQFVMSEKIDTAISKAQNTPQFRYSYDMLGEAAMTDEDAMNYMANYIEAIHKVGMASKNQGVYKADGISVKLSAIHCRYTRLQEDKVMAELYPRLKQLFILAKQYQISLFIDAEESNRLMLSLKLFTKLLEDVDLQGFNGFGFVVQAYQKRALPVIQYLLYLANTHTSRIMVRLVKGAYWDSEIKKAQLEGDTNYSVFTRKYHTDLSYLACAQVLLSYPDSIYPLFATHNVHTLTQDRKSVV